MARPPGPPQPFTGALADIYSDSSSDADTSTHEGASIGACASEVLDVAAIASDLGLESWVTETASTITSMSTASPVADSAPKVLLAYTFRFTDVHRAFFSAMSESGISWQEIPRHEVHRSRFVPEQTDDTDPVVRIFTLHLEHEEHGCDTDADIDTHT